MAKSFKGGQGMNTLYIVIGIVVFILIAYIVYSKWFSNVNKLSSGQINLNVKTAHQPVLASTLTNPSSTRYTYGVWIYVNSWDTTKYKTIFSRYNDILLYLDTTSSVLKCYINPKKASATDADGLIDLNTTKTDYAVSSINITNNFPLQKWVFITIVVDNQIVDMYLDGKMVKSLNITQVQPDSGSNIYYGYNFDAVLNNFQRWSYPLDPQSVYDYYLSGATSMNSSNLTGGYHASITITQNDKPTSTYKVF